VTRLALKDVSVRFGGLLALDAVDLEIVPGHVSGLIGPNGAGKTTLFNVVTGLQSPSRGRVLLDERDVTDMPPHKRARLGLARTFQRLELFGTLTARENVQMAAETQRRRLPQGSTPASVASAVLERVGLTSVAEEPADVLPTGSTRSSRAGPRPRREEHVRFVTGPDHRRRLGRVKVGRRWVWGVVVLLPTFPQHHVGQRLAR